LVRGSAVIGGGAAGVLIAVSGVGAIGVFWYAFTVARGTAPRPKSPEGKRIARAIEQGGPGSPEARMRINRIFLVSRIELLFLLLIVLDMVIKPGS